MYARFASSAHPKRSDLKSGVESTSRAALWQPSSLILTTVCPEGSSINGCFRTKVYHLTLSNPLTHQFNILDPTPRKPYILNLKLHHETVVDPWRPQSYTALSGKAHRGLPFGSRAPKQPAGRLTWVQGPYFGCSCFFGELLPGEPLVCFLGFRAKVGVKGWEVSWDLGLRA